VTFYRGMSLVVGRS